MELSPPRARPWLEAARLARGIARLPSFALQARDLPRGRGQSVLVIPGFLTGDGATIGLRSFLSYLGYRPHGWGLGLNRGNVGKLLPRVVERVEEVATGEPVALIGWSLGGVLAREATRESPELVDRIVTLGTPVVGGPKYTLAAKRYRQQGIDVDAIEQQVAERNQEPLPVPITAIYSRSDAVVAWRACLDPNPDNEVAHVEVRAGHAELGFSRDAYRAIAHALG